MKKLLLCLSALSLTACTSGVDDANLQPVDRGLNIQQICLKGNTRAAPEQFVEAMKNSLQKKNIRAEYVTNTNDKKCTYILAFNARGNQHIVARSKLRVIEVASRKDVGLLSYKLRGDEKDRVGKTGLQLQTDLMINQLFKDY